MIMDDFDPPRVIIRFHTNVDVPDNPAVVLESPTRPAGGGWSRRTETLP
jgi:hypothetical protein